MIEIKNILSVAEIEQELQSILDFWMDNTPDYMNNGFTGEISGDGKRNERAEKGAVLNTRLLWTFSAAYNFFKEPAYLHLADRAYDYLNEYFWDKEFEGLYWSVNYDGSVNNTRKQAYAQGFGIYGFSEYYKASGNKESLDYAIRLYHLIEKHYKDEQYGGYIEALAYDWQPLEDMRLSLKDANLPKSMNTHLHIIEPYTNLYRYWKTDELKKSIIDLIDVFTNKIIDNNTFHFNLFFDVDWTVKSEIVSYGHDIEGAWLLNEAAHFTGEKNLIEEVKVIALKMVDITIKEGMDVDGSLFYEKEKDHLDTDKHWWPQAEALVGLIDAYQNTADDKYMEAANKVWMFIKNHIKDSKRGEWFGRVNKDSVPYFEDSKIGFWKCPYHNSRALIEAITRIKGLSL